VYRPTASCIKRSFLNSGKRHLLITGGRGSGKTTLLSHLCPADVPGITTHAVPREAVFLCERQTGQQAMIGRYDASLPGTENKMVPCPEGFLELGIPALEACMQSHAPQVCIDEIGYLECGCEGYQQALSRLMQKKGLVAAVRKQTLPFLENLLHREDAFVVDLDQPYGNMGCVIMASGEGRRFGSNKLMADFRGQPLICRSLDATEGLFARRVVVTRHPEIAALCEARQVECILHEQPFRSDTIRLGLEAMPTMDGCLFCPGDQPLLTRETVAALLLSAHHAPETIWRTACEDTPGAPVWFPAWAFDPLRTLPQGKGGGYLIRQHPDRVRLVPVLFPQELQDADTPEQLASLAAFRA